MNFPKALIVLFIANAHEVSSEDSLLTVVLGNLDSAVALDQGFSYLAKLSPSTLRSNGLIESLERSRTTNIQEKVESLIWKKIDLETRLREAFNFGSALRIFNLMRERLQLVKELQEAREELIEAKLEILDKRRQTARNLVESDEPISFDLFMRTLSLIYGDDLTEKFADLKREAVRRFEKPFLRPIITLSAPTGLSRNCTVVTAIYQNLKRQNTAVLKGDEFTVVSTITGFAADRLHIGVDFHAVNSTDEYQDRDNDPKNQWDNELISQKELIEAQMNLTQARLEKQLDDLKAWTKHQKKALDSRTPKASNGIEKLENELVRKRTEINYTKAKRQMKLIVKELERLQKFVLELDGIERDARIEEARVAKKIHKKQRKILDEKFEKKHSRPKAQKKKGKKDQETEPNEATSPQKVELTEATMMSDGTEAGTIESDEITEVADITTVTEATDTLNATRQSNATAVSKLEGDADSEEIGSSNDGVQLPSTNRSTEDNDLTSPTASEPVLMTNLTQSSELDTKQTEALVEPTGLGQDGQDLTTEYLKLRSSQTVLPDEDWPGTGDSEGEEVHIGNSSSDGIHQNV